MENPAILNNGECSNSKTVCYQANYHSLNEICFWWWDKNWAAPDVKIVAKFIVKPKKQQYGNRRTCKKS